jgi:cation diffusion facilitator family transporter
MVGGGRPTEPEVTSGPRRQELLAIRLSFFLTTGFAIGAVVVAMFTDSETMSLEAMSALVDVVVAILAVLVIQKVHEPANSRYHFGYAKYEPLMTTVEGILLAGVCVGAIVYAVRDLLHPDPVEDVRLIVVYSAVGFAVSVMFGLWMRRTGKKVRSQLVQAEGELWIVEGWLALGVCAAFAAGALLARTERAEYTAYVDPTVCIILSLIMLRKPAQILRESIADLVDANPYAETANTIEETARAVAQRFSLPGVESVPVRKAGRRVFIIASFFDAPTAALAEMHRIRQSVSDEISRLHPDVDVVVLFTPAR